MDKETLVEYGFVFIAIILLGALLFTATPLSNLITSTVEEQIDDSPDKTQENIHSGYFVLNGNNLTVNKKYKNYNMRAEVTTIKNNKNLSTEEALCAYITNDYTNGKTLKGLEEYVSKKGQFNSVDDYLVNIYGLEFYQLKDLVDGSNAYILPKELTLPDEIGGVKVTGIDDSAFKSIPSIEKIIIPSTITTIKSNAFANCTALKEVVIKEGLTTIENSAFYQCESLDRIELPSTLTKIGSSAFANCSSLYSVKINKPQGSVTVDSTALNGTRVTVSKITYN